MKMLTDIFLFPLFAQRKQCINNELPRSYFLSGTKCNTPFVQINKYLTYIKSDITIAQQQKSSPKNSNVSETTITFAT